MDRWARFAPLTGVVFVALMLVGTVVINEWTYLPAAGDIQELLQDDWVRVYVGAYAAMVGSFFLAWFAGSVRVRLQEAEGPPGRLAAVAFGGGLAAAVCLAIGYGSLIAAAARAGDDAGIAGETAVALYDLSGAIVGNVSPVLFAVLIGAVAVVGLRTGIFAGWINWVSLALAVVLFSPWGWAVLVVVLAWVAWLSFALYQAPDG